MKGSAGDALVDRTTHGTVEVLALRAAEVYRADTIAKLGHELRRLFDGVGAATVFVLDLSDVEFLSSAALGLIINVWSHLVGRGCRFALAGAKGEVAQVLACTRLSEIMTVFPTVEEAVKKLGCG